MKQEKARIQYRLDLWAKFLFSQYHLDRVPLTSAKVVWVPVLQHSRLKSASALAVSYGQVISVGIRVPLLSRHQSDSEIQFLLLLMLWAGVHNQGIVSGCALAEWACCRGISSHPDPRDHPMLRRYEVLQSKYRNIRIVTLCQLGRVSFLHQL